jgi:hypothetical protein
VLKTHSSRTVLIQGERLRGWLVIAACLWVLVGLGVSSDPADSAAFNYNTSAQLHTINVGMLLLDSDNQTGPAGGDHAGWYSFYILNQRDDIRPPGWSLDNPLAPKVVTADMINRYNAAGQYTVGEAVTQNMAPYWEVDISRVNINSLKQFNVLVIHCHNNGPNANGSIDLTQQERLLLRQYIDQGGTLIVEDSAGAKIGPDFLFDVQFWSNGANGFAVVPNPAQRHPIITTPYFLSQDDLNGLGDKEVGNYFMTAGRGPGPMGTTQPSPTVLTEVVGNSSHKDVNGEPFPYIAAGDYGSGHIVMSSADVFDAINNPINSPGPGNQPPPFSGTNFSAAPTQDLKLLVDIISWATGTADTDGVDNRREGSQLSAIDGGVSREWLYPDPGFAPANPFNGGIPTPTPAAISGNIAYVSDGNGYLHAFDIDPPESLSGVLNGDDGGAGIDFFTGLAFNNDLSQGTSYDELWDVKPAGAARLSAPTVANLPGVGACVFVEGDDGTVYSYVAGTTLTPGPTFAAARSGGGTVTPYSGQAPIPPYALPPVPPAPAVYDGRLIAGQPDGTVMVDDLANGNNAYLFNLDSGLGGLPDTTPVIASPAVASIPNRDAMNFGGADIIAYITTEQNTWGVFLGGRDEEVQPEAGLVGFDVSAAMDQKLLGGDFAGVNIINPPEDPLFAPQPAVYYNPGFGNQGFVAPNYAGPPGLVVNPTPVGNQAPPFFSDYDITAPNGTTTSVSRTKITALISTTAAGATINDILPAGGAAVGPDNTVFMTVNEPSANSAYIEAVSEQNSSLGNPGNVIKWRFAMVNTGPDASGISYAFAGYRFIGAPVVDGNTAYALALDPNGTPAVLAFNTDAVCQLQAAADLTIPPSLSQTDENGGNGGQSNRIPPYDFNYSKSTGVITLTNFGQNPPANLTVTADVAAPLPVEVMSNSSQPATDVLTPMNTAASGGPLLRWWTKPLNATTQVIVGPLRKIGNSVYFTANFTNNNNQTVNEIVGVNTATGLGTDNTQFIDPTSTAAQQRTFTTTSTITTGTSIAPLSASGNFAVLQGAQGIEGFGYHPTLVADGNRLVSLGPTGNAIWSVDSTNQLQVQGGNLVDLEVGPATPDQSGTVVASKVSLNHPSSVSQIGQDDYLVADTGNNRVVRLDTAGHVIWEVTSFSDPYNILTPAPTTSAPQSNALLSLNQPASATMWQTSTPVGTTPQVVINHYLIADAGNYRVLEIDDKYTDGVVANPTTDYHYLAWVSHTYDQSSRQYRYVSAQVVPGPGGTGLVMAAVSDTRVAPLVVSGGNVQLAPSSQDSPGSSILLLNYEGANPLANGLPSGNGLPSVVINEVATGTTGNYTLLPMRGLRSAQIFVPPNAGAPGNSLYQIVIADDDGGFSGPIGQVTAPLNSPLTPLSAVPQAGSFALDTTVAGGWSFELADYAKIVAQYDVIRSAEFGNNIQMSDYANTPFQAASVERLPSGDYLVVNRGAVGSAQNLNTTVNNGANGYEANFGGNVFEVQPPNVANGMKNTLVGNILGRPANSGALSSPAFAIRPL